MALSLPTEKSKPNVEPELLKWLIYGVPKVGKTSLCMGFKDPLFLRTSQSTEVASIFKLDIKKWEDFQDAVNLLTKTEHKYKTIVLDVGDDIYHYCVKYCNDKLKIEHISDAAYAKAYHFSDNEFEFWMGKLIMSDMGIIVLSHLDEKEAMENKAKIIKTVPSMQARARRIIEKKVAIITWLKQERVRKANSTKLEYEDKLVMITKQSVEVAAGDWTGRMPDKLMLHTIPDGVQRTNELVEEYAHKNYELIASYIKGEAQKEVAKT